MKLYKANSHRFTTAELDGQYIFTGDGHCGRVSVPDEKTIDIADPVLDGTVTGYDIEYLNDCDVVIMTEEEAAELFRPIYALTRKPAGV